MEKYATKYSIFGNYCQVFPTGVKEWAAKTFYAHFRNKILPYPTGCGML